MLELWYFATCHFIPVLLLFTDENSFSKKIPTDLSISERIEISYNQPSAAKKNTTDNSTRFSMKLLDYFLVKGHEPTPKIPLITQLRNA